MRWSNVRLIVAREVRDQLRDRRTLFMIAVLPLLLYPLLGMSMFQMAQFVRESSTTVWVIGASEDWDLPALVEGQHFARELFRQPERAALLKVSTAPAADALTEEHLVALAEQAIREDRYQAVLYFPPDFGARLDTFYEALDELPEDGGQRLQAASVPSPVIFYNTAKEKSQITHRRLSGVLDRWSQQITEQTLEEWGLPARATTAFTIDATDVALEGHRGAAAWSKILPFMLLIWALTGAFYPAIDLCAGEKERGTLETLLSSPAQRSEIVCGKLLTVMLFSAASAVLNLVALGFTGTYVIQNLHQVRQLAGLGSPPPLAALWLGAALLPVAALFSALCLALAAFARSTKEGQYYLMPLVLVTMPLMMLSMAPGAELNLGNSLIPLTGLMLLLRGLLEGNAPQVMPYVPIVAGVTLLCCLAAIRWAIDQFNSESVLFRESEQLDPLGWLRHLRRDREELPVPAQALLCGLLILVIQFFLSFALPTPRDFYGLIRLLIVSQLVVIATPALLMAVVLTRSVRATLSLQSPARWWCLPAAAGLAASFHPVAHVIQSLVMRLYPVPSETAAALSRLVEDAEHFWILVAVFALVPAVCEELAFRGFILSGLRRGGHKWRAILLSSLFFGVTHPIMQQSLLAFVVGLMIGYIVIQGKSLLVGVAFHATHNCLVLLSTRLDESLVRDWPALEWLVRAPGEAEFLYEWPVVIVAGLLSVSILAAFARLTGPKNRPLGRPRAVPSGRAEALAGS